MFERPIRVLPEVYQDLFQHIVVLTNEPDRGKTASTEHSCDCSTGNTQFRQLDFCFVGLHVKPH